MLIDENNNEDIPNLESDSDGDTVYPSQTQTPNISLGLFLSETTPSVNNSNVSQCKYHESQ